MYLVSFSQPQNAASVLGLSRSHEFEHEVQREVTLQVMHWFGQVDVADERSKMVVEKVARQDCVKSAWVYILRQYRDKVGFSKRLFFFPTLMSRYFVSG